MKDIKLKLKRCAPNVNVVCNNDSGRLTLNMMLCILSALALAYVLLLGNMIFNIVERKSIETNARFISSEVSNLELEYLSMSGKVDLAFAESKGFKETKETKYATRKSFGSLKLAKNEL